MAAYVPATLRTPTALTASAVKVIDPASVTAVVRTFNVSASAASKTFTIAQGTDAAGTRIFDAVALTANVPYIQNGWWVIEDASFWEVKASDTVPVFGAWGYNYS